MNPAGADWHRAGAVSDFAPEVLTPLTVDNFQILAVNHKGRFYAFERLCPHQSRPLDEGEIKDGVLHCRYHSVSFNLDDGAVLDDGGFIGLPNLVICPVRLEGNQVLIGKPLTTH